MSIEEAVTLRFASRGTEFALGISVEVGDKLKRGDEEWVVMAIERDHGGKLVATLSPAAELAETPQ